MNSCHPKRLPLTEQTHLQQKNLEDWDSFKIFFQESNQSVVSLEWRISTLIYCTLLSHLGRGLGGLWTMSGNWTDSLGKIKCKCALYFDDSPLRLCTMYSTCTAISIICVTSFQEFPHINKHLFLQQCLVESSSTDNGFKICMYLETKSSKCMTSEI